MYSKYAVALCLKKNVHALKNTLLNNANHVSVHQVTIFLALIVLLSARLPWNFSLYTKKKAIFAKCNKMRYFCTEDQQLSLNQWKCYKYCGQQLESTHSFEAQMEH